MQVRRTSVPIGYNVTAVNEPIAYDRMWEEKRILSIGVRKFGK